MTTNNIQPHPLVSVVIPVHNRGGQVHKTLDSVYNQSYRPLELIIVNDGSTDETLYEINLWLSDKCGDSTFSTLLLTQRQQGAPAARNHGVERAHGEFIQFLDSDDQLTPQKVSEQMNRLIETKKNVAICDFAYVDEDDKVIASVENTGNLWQKVATRGSLFIATPLIHFSFFHKGLRWEPNLKRNQDIDFNLKLMLLTDAYEYTPGSYCRYVQHKGARISDLYSQTAPEYWKRIKTLYAFHVQSKVYIPTVNQTYYTRSLRFLFVGLIAYAIKLPIKRHLPGIVMHVRSRRNRGK